MNLKIVTLFLLFGENFAYKPRKQIHQRPITSIPKKAIKKLDIVPARYQVRHKILPHNEPVFVKNLPFFPEVEYPTNIMEVSKPFYFRSAKSESLVNDPKVLKHYSSSNPASRRGTRKTDAQDHSNLFKLIESLKKNATKNNVAKLSSIEDNPSAKLLMHENEITNAIEIKEIPITIEPVLESEIMKEIEINASAETDEASNESEIEIIEYYSTDDCGSGAGDLEILEHYFNTDYSNNNDSSIEYEYPDIFIVDLLEGLVNYTDLDTEEESLAVSDEVCSEETLDDIRLVNNITEEFGVYNSTYFYDNETDYVISQSILSHNDDQINKTFTTPILIAEKATIEGNTSNLRTNNVRSVKKIILPKSLLTRSDRKLHRKKLLSKT